MTDWRSELRRTWAMLATPHAFDVVHTIVLNPGDGHPLRVYTSDEGARHLLIPAARGIVDPLDGEALQVRVVQLDFDGSVDRRFLDISCHRPELFDIFDELLASIVTEAVDSGDPVRATVDMLRRWRDLLRSWSAAMSHEAEMGLFAELAVLELVSRRMPVLSPAIWRGPLREPKDLVGDGWWVEVKAVGSSSRTVQINGLDQLAEIEGAMGHLAVVTMEEDPAGRSIDDLTTILRDRTDDVAAFDRLLLDARWVPHDQATNWVVRAVDVVPSVACPTLTVDPTVGVHPAIGRIRYELDLGMVRALRVPDPESTMLSIGG